MQEMMLVRFISIGGSHVLFLETALEVPGHVNGGNKERYFHRTPANHVTINF